MEAGEKGTRQKDRRQSPEARAHAFHFACGAMIHCPEKKAWEKCHVKHIGMKRQQKECRIQKILDVLFRSEESLRWAPDMGNDIFSMILSQYIII